MDGHKMSRQIEEQRQYHVRHCQLQVILVVGVRRPRGIVNHGFEVVLGAAHISRCAVGSTECNSRCSSSLGLAAADDVVGAYHHVGHTR